MTRAHRHELVQREGLTAMARSAAPSVESEHTSLCFRAAPHSPVQRGSLRGSLLSGQVSMHGVHHTTWKTTCSALLPNPSFNCKPKQPPVCQRLLALLSPSTSHSPSTADCSGFPRTTEQRAGEREACSQAAVWAAFWS